jgi:hypothetical protein
MSSEEEHMPRPTLLPHALAILICGCTTHDLVAPNPMPEEQTDKYVPITVTRKADILFMIDNSLSMKEEQDNLARNFPAFIDELRKIKGGLPDVHIGVVTSDVGAGPLAQSGCAPGGRDGAFQGWDKACGLDPNSRFIVASDGEHTRNYQDDLAKVFACMADVGTKGCGFEHQLEATRRALTVHGGGEAGGFLRKDAYLQIVLITDEDDCSAPSTSDLFGMSFPGEEPSFRCARAGHTCNGQMPPAGNFSAPLSQCKPVENGALTNVGDFVAAIRALKEDKDQDKILVSGIFGWPLAGEGNYEVGKKTAMSGWDFLPACESINGEATAALRVKQFVDAFGKNGTFQSICSGDFRPILAGIGEKLKVIIDAQGMCVDAPLVDTKPAAGVQADCLVSDSVPANGGYDKTYFPPCELGAKGSCWKVERDDTCTASGFRVEIDRKGATPKPETQVGIQCRTCVKADDPRCHR